MADITPPMFVNYALAWCRIIEQGIKDGFLSTLHRILLKPKSSIILKFSDYLLQLKQTDGGFLLAYIAWDIGHRFYPLAERPLLIMS